MNKVMEKTEVGKIRAIVGSDVWTYTRMKYVSDNCLNYFFGKTNFSPLFMSNDERVKMWRRLCTLTGWRMPLDQTEFDQMQTKKCILIVIKLLKKHFAWLLGKYDYFFDLIYVGLDKGKVLCVDNEGNIVWVENYNNGVMSGWYWTAFMDTVLNVITSKMALRLVKEQTNVQIDMTMFYCQGDDDAFEFSTYLTCVMVYHAYIIMGYKVNRKKFYIDNRRDEFLRKSFTENRVSGYPARSVANILFASPERTNNNDEDVASARLSVWWRFSNRLGCKVERLPLIQDISAATKLPTADIQNWLYTPREFGGGGLDMTYSYFMNVTTIKREVVDKKQKNLFGLPGWRQFKTRFSITDDSLLEATTQSKKGVNSKHVTIKKGNITCYSVPLSLTIHQGTNYRSQSLPRYEWEPRLGSIGRYSDIEPYNKEQIDILVSGFTRKLKEEFSEGLSLKGKLVRGLSEECTSFFANQYLPQVFQRLTLSHRSTIIDLQMMNLRVNKIALDNLDFSWEE